MASHLPPSKSKLTEQLTAFAPTAAVSEDKVVIIESRSVIRGCMVGSISQGLAQTVLAYGTVNDWVQSGVRDGVTLVILCINDVANASAAVQEIENLLRHTGSAPLVVSAASENPDLIVEALRLGARGYIPTSLPLGVWIEALRLVRAGGVFAPAGSLISVAQTPSVAPTRKADIDHVILTARQIAVVDALRHGKANKIIAYELNMCESTVKVHVRNIMKKLHAKNRTEVALMAEDLLKQYSSSV